MDINDYRKVAHRGLYNNEEGIIENTIPAFEKAINEAVAIEFDIRYTYDKKIVVFHDNDLKRLANVDKKVEECKLEELKKVKLLNTNIKIPTLDEVLDLVDGKVPLLIEIKSESKESSIENLLVERLKKYNGKYIVESFNPFSIFNVKQLNEGISVGQLVKGEFNIFKEAILKAIDLNFKPNFLAYSIDDLTEEIKEFCKENDMYLLSWTIDNNEKEIKAKNLSDGIIFENK